MLRKTKIKNKPRWLWFVLLVVMTLPVFAPKPALAYNFTAPVAYDGYEVCPGEGWTRRVVPCIKENIIAATNTFLMPFSRYMATAVSAFCTLAIAIWGIGAVAGKRGALTRDMTVLMLKIFFVNLFTANFAGLFGTVLDAMDDILNIVSGYAIHISGLSSTCADMSADPANLQVWDTVDCAIETLIGSIYSPYTLAMGIAGFLFAALFSGTVGLFIAVMGFYLVVQILFAIAKAAYIFISAYMAFALMVIVSPIFIPLILFGSTKGYFDRWLRLIGIFMLQPIVLFAYLAMLTAALDIVVFTGPSSIYRTVAGSAVDERGFEMGAYLEEIAYGEKDIDSTAIDVNPIAAAQDLGFPSAINSGLFGKIGTSLTKTGLQLQQNMDTGADARTFLKVSWPTTAINWQVLVAALTPNPHDNQYYTFDSTTGTWYYDTNAYLTAVLMSFMMALLTAYVFIVILDSLPFITTAIAGTPITSELPALGMGKLAPPGAGMVDTFRAKMSDALRGGM